MYTVLRATPFERMMSKCLDKTELALLERFEQGQLRTSPHVGHPLGYPFLREKRIGGKRVYYLVYDNHKVVMLVGISDKKTQQATIDAIKSALGYYKAAVDDAVKRRAALFLLLWLRSSL